jgi:malonyl CoA-acyl carrier protein transacylase
MVLGHSSGEIVAAYAAGAITMSEAMSAAYHRGQAALLAKARHANLRGAMMAVGCGASEVQQRIKMLGLYELTAACHNSPNSTTVSGDEDAIDILAAQLEQEAIFNRKLRVDVAYHSAHMGLVAEDYLSAIKDISPRPCISEVAFYSSVLGKYNDTESLGAPYWVNNLVKPVLFSTALQSLYTNEKPDVLIEVGPHAALEGPIKQILRSISPHAGIEVKYLPTLVRNQNSATSLVNTAGKLFLQGHALNFGQINQASATQRPNLITDLPPYPWELSMTITRTLSSPGAMCYLLMISPGSEIIVCSLSLRFPWQDTCAWLWRLRHSGHNFDRSRLKVWLHSVSVKSMQRKPSFWIAQHSMRLSLVCDHIQRELDHSQTNGTNFVSCHGHQAEVGLNIAAAWSAQNGCVMPTG